MVVVMIHTVYISCEPKAFTPSPDFHPFHIVRQEKAVLLRDGILAAQPIGIRLIGYFRYAGDIDDKVAAEALAYGLMRANFRLQTPEKWDLGTILCARKEELIAAANAALADAESPCRLTEVVFTYADDCFHDGSTGQSTQRYSGFVMGGSGMQQIIYHKPKGIPGEWQCVCGAYTTGDVCAECGIACPRV